jgi:serine/threonine-protein kinase
LLLVKNVSAIVGKKIDKYEITGVLGEGGMGIVYRAVNMDMGRSVAIKMLNEGFSGQPEMRRRFYKEAQAPLHPNIAIVFDVGEDEGKLFIVMEFVEGEPLNKLVSSDKPLPLIDKLNVIEQVCAGLGFAHQKGVIHRDIKPANIIVNRSPLTAKIVDFGIATVQTVRAETRLTETGKVIGTVPYMAPERLRDIPSDGRVDIFATGVMLYLLLTGRLPFPDDPVPAVVMQRILNEPHPPLSNWLTNYPPALDWIIDRALAKEQDDRYLTAEEFGADLHAVIDELKKGQVEEMFADAKRLTSELQLDRAFEVLNQVIKIAPLHTEARHLLSTVTQTRSKQQRAEQMRKLLADADEALGSARYTDAISMLDQAVRRDPNNTGLKDKLDAAKEKKWRHDEIANLMSQADSLRTRGDLTGALNLVDKALMLDEHNTAIRTVHADLARQAKLLAQQGKIKEMLGKARDEISAKHYTAAIELLREAGKLDPSQAEVEKLLQIAATAQEEVQRRRLIEGVHADIERCLSSEEFDRATELAELAVQRMPTETSLIQLK